MRYPRILPTVVLALVFPMIAKPDLTLGTIHIFNNKPSGINPLAPLTADSQGNLYGTTFAGGQPGTPNNNCSQYGDGCGVVFKLTPSGDSQWNYSVIYRFLGAPSDGENPTDVLTIDSAGNIYGSTVHGGTASGGTVYELSPAAGGAYTERVLYSFTGAQGPSHDGFSPQGVIMDSTGRLYGATVYGGNFGFGTAWALRPNGSGTWTEQILHSFGNGFDGKNPQSSLLLDKSGNLFGTTYTGGAYNGGTAFELSMSAGPQWTESILHSFGTSGDGCNPHAPLIADASGNLYGTTQNCASFGTVFELSPQGAGYTEKVIHYFLDTAIGAYPEAPVTFDSAGNLYGTTMSGGQYNAGVLYKLMPAGGGGWIERDVHSFTGDADGALPMYGVIVGPKGHLFGTTPFGGNASGASGFGVVFEYRP